MELAKEDGDETYATIPDEALKGSGFTKENLDYKEVVFMQNKVDSKQKAMKVHMNTFYGEQGNFRSSIYNLLVAGTITQMGQKNIKMVAAYLEEHGYTINYGDTDSVYISCPDRIFVDVDAIHADVLKIIEKNMDVEIKDVSDDDKQEFKNSCDEIMTKYRLQYKRICVQYNDKEIDSQTLETLNKENFQSLTSALVEHTRTIDIKHKWTALKYIMREAYWAQLVQITRRDIEELRKRVNDMSARDNGTYYLNMAYEEVLFPVVLTGKKKYFGFEHMKDEDFHPEEMFIRGIDVIKQGQSELSKEVGKKIMYECLSVENELSLIQLVERSLREIYATNWDIKYFILTGRYKPHRQNVKIHTFHDRMVRRHAMYSEAGKLRDEVKAAICAPPVVGDPFQYVMVKKESTFNLKGKRKDPSKGDMMEYLAAYNASQSTSDPMEIDLSHYMEGAIYTQFARFIAYHTDFIAPDYIQDNKLADEFTVKAAIKYIKQFCSGLIHKTGASLRVKGNVYRKISHRVTKYARSMASNVMNKSAMTALYDIELPTYEKESDFEDNYKDNQRLDETIADAMKNIEEYVRERTVSWEGYGEVFMKYYKKRLKKEPSYIHELWEKYRYRDDVRHGTVMASRFKALENKIMIEKNAVLRMIPRIIEIKTQHEKSFETIVMELRQQFNEKDEFEVDEVIDDDIINRVNVIDDESKQETDQMYEFIESWIAYESHRRFLSEICMTVQSYRNKKIGLLIEPTNVAVERETRVEKQYEILDTPFRCF